MISPHTPPGTKVVFLRSPRSVVTNEIVDPFRKGDEVTISDIFPVELVPSGYAAFVEESNRFYCLSLFRRAVLPDCIVSALTDQPIDIKVDEFHQMDDDAARRIREATPYASMVGRSSHHSLHHLCRQALPPPARLQADGTEPALSVPSAFSSSTVARPR
jgi:hypothetical protein